MRVRLLLFLLASGCAGGGASDPTGLPPSRLLPLPRPDDGFSIRRTSIVDGRTVTSDGSATVRWTWAADAADGTEVKRTAGLREELWWRSETGLALWDGEHWVTIEGRGPIGTPVSRDRGTLSAAVSTESSGGSGEATDGCIRLRLVDRPATDSETMPRVEERTLCPDRGEATIDLTARGALGQISERWIRR